MKKSNCTGAAHVPAHVLHDIVGARACACVLLIFSFNLHGNLVLELFACFLFPGSLVSAIVRDVLCTNVC